MRALVAGVLAMAALLLPAAAAAQDGDLPVVVLETGREDRVETPETRTVERPPRALSWDVVRRALEAEPQLAEIELPRAPESFSLTPRSPVQRSGSLHAWGHAYHSTGHTALSGPVQGWIRMRCWSHLDGPGETPDQARIVLEGLKPRTNYLLDLSLHSPPDAEFELRGEEIGVQTRSVARGARHVLVVAPTDGRGAARVGVHCREADRPDWILYRVDVSEVGKAS